MTGAPLGPAKVWTIRRDATNEELATDAARRAARLYAVLLHLAMLSGDDEAGVFAGFADAAGELTATLEYLADKLGGNLKAEAANDRQK